MYPQDLTELVFAGKNKKYGAYLIRKNYRSNLSAVVIIVNTLFTILLLTLFNPSEQVADIVTQIKEEGIILDQGIEVEIPLPPPPEEIAVPKQNTVEFLNPHVTPDNLAVDNAMPDVNQLRNAEPDIITRTGNPNGPDIITLPQNNTAAPPVENTVIEKPFEWAEVLPEFPGGSQELLKYLSANIHYPKLALKAEVEGRVIVGLVVTRAGEIENIHIIKGIGAGCDEEAVRVIKAMPLWTPGKQNGTPVPVKMTIPILFKIAR